MSLYGNLIYEAECDSLYPVKYVSNLAYIDKYWKLKRNKKSIKSIATIAPKGSYVCNELKLIRQVW